jgi:hypothetical protein
MRKVAFRLPVAMAMAWALAGCAADKAGAEFRQRLPNLVGQPVQLLIDELGLDSNRRERTRDYGWGQMTIGAVSRICEISVKTDEENRILTATMEGSDYYCGSVIRELRKREAHYRRHPGLREREAAELDRMLGELVRARREINEPASPAVEQPDQQEEERAEGDAGEEAEAGLAVEGAGHGADDHAEREQRAARHSPAAARGCRFVRNDHGLAYGRSAAAGPVPVAAKHRQQAVEHARARC